MIFVTLSNPSVQSTPTTYYPISKVHPFYLVGDIGVDIGVGFTLDLWFITIHINVDINGNLHLEGPPMHGTVSTPDSLVSAAVF